MHWRIGPLIEDDMSLQMLRKAGWQPGAGLGAESQGRRLPLEESRQKGRRGLGADAAAAAPTAKRQQAQQEQASVRPRPVRGVL